MSLEPNKVFLARSDICDYSTGHRVDIPELDSAGELNTPLVLLRNLMCDAGLDNANYGTAKWNPMGDVIQQGQQVVIKPNWVLDYNQGPIQDTECLITHTSLLEAILRYVLKAMPEQITICDAPIQSCNFDHLCEVSKIYEVVEKYKGGETDIIVKDLRMTRLPDSIYEDSEATCRDISQYCLFNLKENSVLEDITQEKTEFRVTYYDPDTLREHHCPGKHEYLVAKEIMEADVLISVPKLKTHKKAGITGALKNLVGINGFKEYLPHHRKGGSLRGGDCYEGGSVLKKIAEDIADKANKATSRFARLLGFQSLWVIGRIISTLGRDPSIDGSWYGNDTVWRMCLDLQRIVHYGTSACKLSDRPQRKIITITDAIVAGQGNGPLAPDPVPLGILSMGTCVAAIDYVHCFLIGLDPEKIPLVRYSFSQDIRSIAAFAPDQVEPVIDGVAIPIDQLYSQLGRTFDLPRGWVGHCELAYR